MRDRVDPDYASYGLDELLDVERHIDRAANPERFARLQQEIARRRDLSPGDPRSGSSPGAEARRGGAPGGPADAPIPPLPVLDTVRRALRECRDHWRPLSRALLLPAVGYVGLEFAAIARDESILATALVFALQLLLYSVFAVSCHRIILVGDDSLPNPAGIYWTARETRFAGWSLALAIAVFFPALVATGAVSVLASLIPVRGEPSWAWAVAALPPARCIASGFARLGLGFAATAVDRRPTLAESLDLSRGNGWRLVGAMSIPTVVLIGLQQIANAALRLPEASPAAALLSFWVFLLGAVEIATLSVAYRSFTGAVEAPAVA